MTTNEIPQSDGYVTRSAHIKTVRKEDREADFIFSTAAVDAQDEVVEQKWRLERFLSNPVILFAHRSTELPIGHATGVGMKDDQLVGTIKFASEKANPLAEQVWQSYLEGNIKAVSVGFKPREVRFEKHDDKDVAVLSDNELFEVSIAPLPANPEALERMKALAREKIPAADNERGNEKPETKETTVDNKDIQAALEKANVDLEKTIAELGSEKAKVSALEERATKLEEQRTELQTRCDTLEAAAAEKELEHLVGVKILGDEIAGLVALKKLDEELYQRQLEAVKARPDMNIVREKDQPVITPDNDPKGAETLDEQVAAL